MKAFFLLVSGLLAYHPLPAQPGSVLSMHTIKYEDVDTGYYPTAPHTFGVGVSSLGDLDKDGVEDMVVGARIGPSSNRGGLYLLFLNPDGTVKNTTRISYGEQDFYGDIGWEGRFGWSIALLGDIDHDGTTEIAVGSPFKSGNSLTEGAVWILSLRSNGSVANYVEISEGLGGFTGHFNSEDRFGFSLSPFPDVDNDGVPELLVGMPYRDVTNKQSGRVYLLKLKSNATVKDYEVYDHNDNPIWLALYGYYYLGESVSYTSDLDNNGIPEIVAGVPIKSGTQGALCIIFLDSALEVSSVSRIDNSSPGMPQSADSTSMLGHYLTTLGDINGDDLDDLAIGSLYGNVTPSSTNYIRILFMNAQGMVDSSSILTAASGTPFANIGVPDRDFGPRSLSILHDLNSDGKRELLVGSPAANASDGQVHIINLEGVSRIGTKRMAIGNHAWRVFPNPFEKNVHLSLPPQFQNRFIRLSIFDMTGRKVREVSMYPPHATTVDLEISEPAGVYLLRLEDSRGILVEEKVVKK